MRDSSGMFGNFVASDYERAEAMEPEDFTCEEHEWASDNTPCLRCRRESEELEAEYG